MEILIEVRLSIKILLVSGSQMKMQLELLLQITGQFANSIVATVKGTGLCGKPYRCCVRRGKRIQHQVCQTSLVYSCRGQRSLVLKPSDRVPLNTNTEKAQASKPSESLFLVPFSRDPLFLGREDIMDSVDAKFKTERRVALTGVGGVG